MKDIFNFDFEENKAIFKVCDNCGEKLQFPCTTLSEVTHCVFHKKVLREQKNKNESKKTN